VLGAADGEGIVTVKIRYQKLRSAQHPDNGGSSEQFNRIQNAWEQAQRELSE